MPRDLPGARLRERGGLARWFWVVWSLVAVSIAVFSAMLVVTHARVVNRTTVPAVLQNRLQETVVTVPSGIPLKQVLIEPGDPIAVGQTIALFDTALIELKLSNVQRSVLVNNILRSCFQSGEMPPEDALKEGVDSETKLQIDRVARECSALHYRHAAERKRIAHAQRNLDHMQDELETRLGRAILNSDSPSLKARVARQISLARNLHVLRAEKLDVERVALQADQQRELADLLVALEGKVADDRAQELILQSALDVPRLQSPESGWVSDVRTVELNHAHAQELSLARIRAGRSDEFVAEFSLPRSEANSWRVGQPVLVDVAGFGPGLFRLNGFVSDRKATADLAHGQPVVRYEVSLDEEATQTLGQAEGLKPLNGSTTTEVVVSQSSERLLILLFDAVSQLGQHSRPVADFMDRFVDT